ncbi:MAG: glucose-1-phosphate adenylyltransferase [Acidobacteria bacterium]|nr:glucose-1-phosphate adenylyltransferase [Acidobacteriota bacterium]
MERILTILLAGGVGERLAPLTVEEPKPMMPFGGIYRLIDVTLSNCVNSGLTKILVVTQHKALSLNRHIREAWNILSPELGQFIEAVPPTRRLSDTWYLGTADAVYQNIQSIEEEGAPYTLVLSADHIYKMNYQHMLEWHIERCADVSVATTQVAPEEAPRFGIVGMDESFRIHAFEEKPGHDQPLRSRFNPSVCSASMGVYLFSTAVLLEALLADAEDLESAHDFGRDVLPKLLSRQRVVAYDFIDENRKEIRYWRDVGTLDAYYEANMDLVAVTPIFNLYNPDWPIRTAPSRHPPAKFVFADEGRRMGIALDSLVSHGCIVSGGRVVHSVLSPNVRVNSHCIVENCVLFPNVVVGRYSRIRRAIIDQNIRLPESTEIGVDSATDIRAGHIVTDSGLVVVHRESAGVEYLGRRSTRVKAVEAFT